jgi:uncharacterized protein YjbJ (UPF0337 family)
MYFIVPSFGDGVAVETNETAEIDTPPEEIPSRSPRLRLHGADVRGLWVGSEEQPPKEAIMAGKVASRTAGKKDEVKGKVKAGMGRARGKPLDEAAGRRQKNRGKMNQVAGNVKNAGKKIAKDVKR